MCATPASGKGRDIVACFAGHLAHLVNGDDIAPSDSQRIEIKPFSLYERIRRSLAANGRYANELVGTWAYTPPHGADEAADFYFDQVLDRPIQSRRGEPSSAENLAALVKSRAEGPCPPKREGALSAWKALVGGPTLLRRFRAGPEMFELSNRILKCLDASNRPYAEVLRLGLCPKEWLVGDEAVGVNTLKSANGFLKALKVAMNGEFGRRPTAAELEAAFAEAPPTHAADVHAFAGSPLGAAILTRVAGQDQTYIVSFDAIEATQAAESVEAEDCPLMEATEAAPYLARAAAAGAIAPPESELLAAILAGRSLGEALGANPFLRRRVKADFDGDVGAYVDDLSARTARFVVESAGRP